MSIKTIILAAGLMMTATVSAQNTPAEQMEQLDRGVVALPASGSGNFISWRLLGTDDEDRTTFNIKRNGSVIAKNVYKTNYVDKSGTKTSKYQIVTRVDGEEVETSEAVPAWQQAYLTLTLDRPNGGSTASGDYTYSPNDMSVGDVDGDGQYELFVKWDPSNSKDNSQDGFTGNVIIDCYKLAYGETVNGTLTNCKLLWRVDLGVNIRAGAHYTQYMVYDFDGDGKAEMMCKTAPGSKDGKGIYVNQASTDENIKAANNNKSWLSSSGRMDGGHEYLTVFSGLTGEAIHTIAYNPNRNATSTLSEAQGTFNWATNKTDTHGYNRGDRYLAGVAFLDGPDQHPSGIFCRGYYTYAFIWAVDFDGSQLKPRWLSSHRTTSSYTLTTYDNNGTASTQSFSNCKPTCGSGSGTMFSNGNHNMTVGDVDGDGCDEIVWGSAALNNDGKLLYGTGFGHGDAIHMADHCPDRPGLEVFQVHEEKGTYAWDLHDAATGEILLKGGPAGEDNGRGMAGQFDANVRGSLFWSASDGSARSAITGGVISENHGSSNFRIYWDGDLQEELADGTKIDKWNGNGTSRIIALSGNTCNSTKNTPCLQADILGDWREEVILHNSADQIFIYTTNTATNYRLPTLMHDHTYRLAVAWQNTAYNQPPHLGYYLPDAMLPRIVGDTKEFTAVVNEPMEEQVLKTRYTSFVTTGGYLLADDTRKSGTPAGIYFEEDFIDNNLTLSGTPSEVGDYRLLVEMNGMGNEEVVDTVTLHVVPSTNAIHEIKIASAERRYYDLLGRKLPGKPRKGFYIIK